MCGGIIPEYWERKNLTCKQGISEGLQINFIQINRHDSRSLRKDG